MAALQGSMLSGRVSRETTERLDLLESLVKKWNPVINLISKGSIAEMYQRHILDSVQIFDLVELDQGVWCDLGSGGGFPGLVVAALAKGVGRQYDIKLVESDSRKAAFLREAVRQLDLTAEVLNSRIEDIPPLSADILSARALGALEKLCSFAMVHMRGSGRALFPKGANHLSEVSAARSHWSFDLTLHPSKTDSAAAILELRNIHHV